MTHRSKVPCHSSRIERRKGTGEKGVHYKMAVFRGNSIYMYYIPAVHAITILYYILILQYIVLHVTWFHTANNHTHCTLATVSSTSVLCFVSTLRRNVNGANLRWEPSIAGTAVIENKTHRFSKGRKERFKKWSSSEYIDSIRSPKNRVQERLSFYDHQLRDAFFFFFSFLYFFSFSLVLFVSRLSLSQSLPKRTQAEYEAKVKSLFSLCALCFLCFLSYSVDRFT